MKMGRRASSSGGGGVSGGTLAVDADDGVTGRLLSATVVGVLPLTLLIADRKSTEEAIAGGGNTAFGQMPMGVDVAIMPAMDETSDADDDSESSEYRFREKCRC